MVYHIIIIEKQGDFQGDYFQEIRQQSSTAEKNDEQQRPRGSKLPWNQARTALQISFVKSRNLC